MSTAIIEAAPFTLLDSFTRVSVTINDDAGVPADPTRLFFKMMDIGGTPLIEDIWPAPATRIVRVTAGKFYVDIGPQHAVLNGAHASGLTTLTVEDAYPLESADWESTGSLHIDIGKKREHIQYISTSITAGAGTITLAQPLQMTHATDIPLQGYNSETTSLGTFLLDWQHEMSVGGAIVDNLSQIKIVSPKTTIFLPDLRQMIDKSRKFVAPQSECFLGYTDTQLLTYLEGGLTNINAYQPSLVFTFENFPLEYKQILVDAGLLVGVMSQQLYAVDTDLNSYSDAGNSFVITHQPGLASFFNQLSARLDKLIPQMKLQLISTGMMHSKMGPDYRLNTMVQSAGRGSLFRNVFFKA